MRAERVLVCVCVSLWRFGLVSMCVCVCVCVCMCVVITKLCFEASVGNVVKLIVYNRIIVTNERQ